MNFNELLQEITDVNAELIAVSKTHSPLRIQDIYHQGQRAFGENKVQELMDKVDDLPQDIQWHMIGHLQSNKVKFIAPFIHLIHSLDRISLAKEINKEGKKANRVIPCLLQIKIASEKSKFGIAPEEIDTFITKFNSNNYDHIRINGVMGMATFTSDEDIIRKEFGELEKHFKYLKEKYFINDKNFSTKSYGMSSDYKTALSCGSNMVRIGSLIFGQRNY